MYERINIVLFIIADCLRGGCMKTNIVMPAYGAPELTERSVRSILNNTHHDFKLIVVNNGLSETDEVMKDFLGHPNLLYLVVEKNQGCGYGRNIGMKEVDDKFDYLFIVDSDIYVPKNWDKKMVDFMEKNKNVGLAGPSTNYAGSPQLVKDCPELETDEAIEDFTIQFEKLSRGHSICYPHWPVIGFCQIMRKEVFDKIGFFDEKFKFYGCEDNDYCWRVQCHGWDLAYLHDIFVYHHGHGGFNLLSGEEINHWGKNRDYFKQKHGWV